jgi:hypothetical protein
LYIFPAASRQLWQQRSVKAFENRLREDYNSAEGEWDGLKAPFEPMFGAIDANDRAPVARHHARAVADHG